MLVGGKLSPITPSLNINTFVVVSEQHHVELGVGSSRATIERSVRIMHSYDDGGEEFLFY